MRFRFTIRDLLWLIVVAALTVGWWVDHRKLPPTAMALYPRYNYANCVLDLTFILWTPTNAISKSWVCSGGGQMSQHGDDNPWNGYQDFVFHDENDEIKRDVLKSLITLYHNKEIFSGPQMVNTAADTALLVSEEGWLELKAKWLEDDPRRIRADDDLQKIRVLRVESEMHFHPRVEASAKQDCKLLKASSPPTSAQTVLPANT